MNSSLKKLWSDYGIVAIIGLIAGLFLFNSMHKYFASKGASGSEGVGSMDNQYQNKVLGNTGMPQGDVQPAAEGANEVYSSVNDNQVMSHGAGANTISDSSQLLPADNNGQWAQLNPAGTGELASINLLKAGYHIGIDTVGQTLRNANLQLRSEPPNPQMSVGPWNNTTISPDLMRVPLEIGNGPQ
jgi:hypothetical protein